MMASAAVLQKLNQRAKQAETMIMDLRSQIEQLRQNAAVSISKPEEERLKGENQKLRVQVEELKMQLILAEVRNGVKQVPLPLVRSVAKSTTETTKVDTSSAGKETSSVQNEGKPAKKTKNEEKPKQSGEPKAKKGKGDAKAAPVEDKMDVSRLDFKVGKIVDVKKHPDADTLYVEEVDLGEERNRTVVSGLVKHVPLEEMQNRVAVFMCNLKPAKMRGILSEAMIMCASTPEKVEILVPPSGSEIGDKVTVKEYPGTPDAQLNPKKKVWETLKPDLRTNKEKVAVYKGAPLQIEGKGQLKAPTLADVQIQ